MKKYFDDPSSVSVKVLLEIDNGAVALLPEGFLVLHFIRQALVEEQFRMHPDHQHFFVVGAIEDPYFAAFRKPAGGAPEKIMLQFLSARLFEAGNVAALRVDPGHDVGYGSVLARRIHPLKNQQQCVPLGGVVKLLQFPQPLPVLCQLVLVLFLGFGKWLKQGWPLREFHIFAWRYTEAFCIDFHSWLFDSGYAKEASERR